MNDSDPLVKKIKQTLDQQQLDGDTLHKLAEARHNALQHKAVTNRFHYLKPALAFAGLAALAIAISLSITPEEATTNMDIFESMDIITSRDDLEMYENLEFYLWLDEQIKS